LSNFNVGCRRGWNIRGMSDTALPSEKIGYACGRAAGGGVNLIRAVANLAKNLCLGAIRAPLYTGQIVKNCVVSACKAPVVFVIFIAVLIAGLGNYSS